MRAPVWICFVVTGLLACSGFTWASDAHTYAPIIKLRTDLQCWPSHVQADGGNVGDCRSRSAFDSDRPPVYWEQHTTSLNGVEATLITYWVYYSHQPACSTFGGAHVNDWERITVHLQDGVLRHVTYNQHNGRYTLDAANVPLQDGTHPVVYQGKYSHGSYHDQRAKCSLDGACYLDGNYCFYWKDPRGPGVDWLPELQPLSALDASLYFQSSANPHSRTRPHHDTVCRTDGGSDPTGLGIGLENTCERNPDDLKDASMTLEQMAIRDLVSIPLAVTAAYGGGGGSPFDDRNRIPADGIAYLDRILIRTGSRVDRIEMQLVTGNGNTLNLAHGGNGGSARSLTLAPGETVQRVEVHTGRKDGSTRVFYLKFTTSHGRVLAGGSTTGTRYLLDAPAGYQIVASHGRAGSELDRVGFVLMPK